MVNGANDLESKIGQADAKEARLLRRKLALAEANLLRAQLIAAAQERTEMILNDSLKKELQFFKLVLDNTNNILLLFDIDGRFAYASRVFLTDAGIANFGFINGRHYKDVLKPLISAKNLLKFSEAVERAVTEKVTVTLEEQIDLSLKGTPRTFSILITPMTDDDGKSTGIMAMFNDITRINDAMETAKRANMAKSDFLANMSHEIRTPLNAIIGMSAIAQASSDIEKIRYCLERINDSTNHLLGVINDILDMSKIEANHFELSYSAFAFEKMLLRIVDVMRFKIEEKHIAFSVWCDPAIPYVIRSDEQRLAQVIMNLMSNAVKFTPEHGSIELRAQVERADGDDHTLRISVKDSGIGISEEQRPRLFKTFSQADSSISRKFGGTGLGLVISKSIVNLMGGDIWFESVADGGTSFIFTIKTQAVKQNPDAKKCWQGARILAVDPAPDVLTAFSLYCEKLGVPITTAESAEEALGVLREQPHDIVFVDWQMPGVDGFSFVKRLCDVPGDPMIVAMIAAADWTEIEARARGAGVHAFVSKPILLPVIEGVLNKYREDSANRQPEDAEDFSGMTVLLADDIEINREIIISLLEHTGVNIICAGNGREAVEAFNAMPEAIDFIFMDVQMPEMDGYEATRRIRALGGNAALTVPIVAMTANVFKEDIERCLACGMNDHIGKPVNVEEVLRKIKQWTRKAG